MALRVIHILHHSPSSVHRGAWDSLRTRSGWHLETAYYQKRYIPGITVECWTPERILWRTRETEFRGIPHHWYPSVGIGYQREVSRAILRRLAELGTEDVHVFLHGSVSYFSSLLLLTAQPGLRIYAQNHGERPTARRYAREKRKPVDHWLRVHLEARALPRAHRILCLNAQNIEDYLACGVDAARLVLSTMGVDSEIFHHSPEARRRVRRTLGVENGELCIGFVGRLAPEKRVSMLLAAMEHLPEGTVLVIAGDGPLSAQLRAHVGTRHYAPRVRFVGHVGDRAQLNSYYNAFDLLVLPSSAEGFGVAIIEAMAAGTPVLATDHPGTQRLLGDGAAGRLTRATDGKQLAADIAELAREDRAPDALSEQARQYSWRTICELHRSLMETA